MKKKGFSLIELIVVVTIIAIVTVVGAVSFGGTNKKARDGRRMADLEKVRVALEMAKQVGNTYPLSLDLLVAGGYLQAVPSDPKAGKIYNYSASSLYTYTLDAELEDLGSTNGSYGADCGAGTVCNYRVTNP